MEITKFDSKVSWAVVMACAFLNVFVLIPTKLSGLFFVEILDRYQVSRNLASYPAFIIVLVRCSGGPLAGYCAERFGINEVMILGSVLAAVGISACFFAEDIAAVIVFLGLIHGTGVACTQTFFPQIVTMHFRKHLSLAFGITQAGACVGSFFSPPLLLWVFQSYGTSGGFLLIGAITLNCLPIALILNILSPNKLYNKSGDSMKSKKSPKEHLEIGMTTRSYSFESEGNSIRNNIHGKKEMDLKIREGNADSERRNTFENKPEGAFIPYGSAYDHKHVVPSRIDGVVLSHSIEFIMHTLSETEKDQMELVFPKCGIISEEKLKNTIHEKRITVATDEKINEMQYASEKVSIPMKFTRNNLEENLFSNDYLHIKNEYKSEAEIDNEVRLKYRAEKRKDCSSLEISDNNTPPLASVSVVSASSCLVDHERTQQNTTKENTLTNLNDLNERPLESKEASNQEINKKEVLQNDKKLTTQTTSTKNSLKIFLDVTFWIVIITQSVHVFVQIIFWTTMIDFARDKDIERSKEVYLLMVLPIAETIGRLGLGWITDSEYLSRINFSILCFIVMGCSCSLMAWAQGFIVVMTSIFVFGVISSCLITVFPMIIFEFFDSTRQTMGQASKYCVFGPLSFLIGPLIGYFRGTLGSYAWLYQAIAIISVSCGALSALIPVLARIRDEKKNERG